MPLTMFEKIWNAHVVNEEKGTTILYIDRHLVHEVTSPQAFEGLRLHNRTLRCPHATYAVPDHNVPTQNQDKPIDDEISRIQVETLRQNCKDFGVKLFDLCDERQGIVHVMAPEQGLTLPGTTIVCGDSHTSTHGAFGALAFGIGTSEVEHVFATQTLQQKKPKTMQVEIQGVLPDKLVAKDLILAIIGKIGVSGGAGYVFEYAGEAIKKLSMEGRMTLCNMSIEAGARAGLVAPDETTFEYLKGRPYAPSGKHFEEAVQAWKQLPSDTDAVFDKTVQIDVSQMIPQVTWGVNPGMVIDIEGRIPSPKDFTQTKDQNAVKSALNYMGLTAGTKIQDVKVDCVFIGSCTNARIEDLREAAFIVKGQSVASHVRAMIVPGSGLVKKQAEHEGLDQIFKEAGFEWREPGCSMCLAMNNDRLAQGERCASTSNRNFEGRQGKGGRTHLVSPATAAATAIQGHFADFRHL